MNIVNDCIFTIIIRIVSYRIENNHIVSLRIDTYRIVWWPYRLIPSQYALTSDYVLTEKVLAILQIVFCN